MSSVKSLCNAGKVRKILALASVCVIIFLSWIIIDKDNSIAQPPEKDYVATTYIKINDRDHKGIVIKSGRGSSTRTICDALDLIREANGDFTLIEIEVDGRTQLIIAKDVCVCEDASPAISKPVDTTDPSTDFSAFRDKVKMKNETDVQLDRRHAWVGYQYNPQVCRWFDGNYV